MHCDIQILDAEENPWFIGKRDFPIEMIFKLAAERLPMAQEMGLNKMQGAIPAFGIELAKIAKQGGSEDAIDKAVFELLLITVVVEQCMGIEESTLAKRNFNFVIYETGAVRYDRIDA
ncbi:hypothetical protein PSTH68_18385 [Pseudomonas syringae pv. theae]|uniref:hypothetical protein n=1 Tax=Pseudomonas syringae TaxID=317 RepID=UPI0005789004|nr:hypothetical protein [Pseudomonas syringae]MBL3875293.1 hypothetical protein [Pseudomonas syringae pv. theae]GKQ31518.1 hypothetical protein PSTH68_18385 [Pseudomonas syringae pv. theae]